MFKGMRLQAVPREWRLLKIKKVFKESRHCKTKCLRSRGFARLQKVFKETRLQATLRGKELRPTLTKSRLLRSREYGKTMNPQDLIQKSRFVF
ncbi:hypothetical protein L484_018549 [Morus notabilis]|uniref:Uncharacterized protein n=1 Tax=Morus notabilis TaxID=981085 RepID=W9QRS0_9ROSA|nr:hypothetical protein L484_018549 [Morus notabilis]